jgi:hypothetical protein
MNRSTFNYHYNGRIFKEVENKKQQSLNALAENLILETCMIFSMASFRGKLKS